ncbi:MAG TPA: RdgB/HAM1 family non-canonical purine NTP pyrophosphatase [Mesotoga infera]|jgi:XTP/dITP diphosphohydrolase|nr:RdgB/HAM1 family non-canonical purine NTP pyrophosphatase [Mesotoga infera]
MRLYLVSGNHHKFKEIEQLLPEGFDLDLITSIVPGKSVAEDAGTFYGNALKKIEAYRNSGVYLLSDDSGLVIDSLGGFPGVNSARFMEGASYRDKMQEILARMKGEKKRTARFICAALFYDCSSGSLLGAEGSVEGRIAPGISGTEGFGYDPIFIPDGYDKTFGELGCEVKNRLSHRAIAFKKLFSLVCLYNGQG